MRFLSHSICLRRSNRKEVWAPVFYAARALEMFCPRREIWNYDRFQRRPQIFSYSLSPCRQMFYSRQTRTFFFNYNSAVFYSVDFYPFLFFLSFPRFILCSCILCFPFSLDFHFYSSSASTPWIPVVFLSFSGKRIVNKYSSCPSIKERCGANTEKKGLAFRGKIYALYMFQPPPQSSPIPTNTWCTFCVCVNTQIDKRDPYRTAWSPLSPVSAARAHQLTSHLLFKKQTTSTSP